MADPHIYHEGELPIAVPSADLAWQDMHTRLDREQSRQYIWLPRAALTLVFLASWLVILEPQKRDDTLRQNTKTIAHSGTVGILPDPTASVSPVRAAVPGNAELQEAAGGQKTTTRIPARHRHTTTPGKKITGDDHPIPNEPARQTVTTKPGEEIFSADPPTAVPGKTIRPGQDSSVAKKTTPPDTAIKPAWENKENEPVEETGWQLRYGPQWDLQIPTFGAYGYFEGPSAKAAPWRLLLPAIWLEVTQGKNALNIAFDPFHAQVVPEKPFRTQNSLLQNGDTTISREETKSLYKIFGLSATLGYARNMRSNWWAGLELQAAWWQQGLARSEVLDTYIVSGQVIQVRPSSYTFKISDEWLYVNKMQMYLFGDLYYRKKRWQAGLRAGMALTPLSKGDGPANMFRGSLVFRRTFGK